jgi:sugar O-acyltransferase (sialic acid O-acetyltransferase NeuD family)
MKQLVIIGAGGFGREVLEWARHCPAYRREWEIAGFLDDNPQALWPFPDVPLPILGDTRDYQPQPRDVFICAMGKPALRAEMRRRFQQKGGRFTRLVHESCRVASRVELGDGVILCPGVVLTCDIAIGPNCALNVHTAVGHDAVIGADCQLSSFCDITGYVRLGERVFLGSRASVIPGRRVGDGAVVGAGSVVITNVPPRVTVFGNPARIITRHQ